ncbi:MAG: hypothetical protein IKX30_17050 [Victivallales bacterium]|nr:hypothetical protein [Victivallales bacterium]
MELYHLPAKRIQTAAAAGAVWFIRDQRLVSTWNPWWCRRPGGEAICERKTV